MKNMNLPNKLTLLRVMMIPVFIVVLMISQSSVNRIAAAGIFILASLTDTLDGYLARKNNEITVFGKFMDPLADKLLVCSALICLVQLHQIDAWIVILIVAREFIISGFRLIAAEKGTVIAASWWGKIKTVVQMIMVIVLVFDFGGYFDMIGSVLIWASMVLTVVSLVDYLYKNRGVLSEVH